MTVLTFVPNNKFRVKRISSAWYIGSAPGATFFGYSVGELRGRYLDYLREKFRGTPVDVEALAEKLTTSIVG